AAGRAGAPASSLAGGNAGRIGRSRSHLSDPDMSGGLSPRHVQIGRRRPPSKRLLRPCPGDRHHGGGEAMGTAADILAVVAKTLPRNDEIADQLDLLADIMELEAGDYFRIQAYRKAATRIRETAVAVAQLA